MKDELVRNGFDPTKIEIHAPVPRMGDPSLRSSFSERNLIIYAGQIVRGKGVDVLLESLAQVRVPFECFLFGDGNYRRTCEYLADKLGLNNRVHFKGYVPQDELQLHYREASVAVVSSVWPEPLPRTLIESINAGRATICSTAGGIPEISGFSNMVGAYEPDNFSQLADLMMKAVSDSSKWKMTQPLQSDFAQKFSPDSVTRQYMEVYSVVNSNAP